MNALKDFNELDAKITSFIAKNKIKWSDVQIMD